MPTPMTLAMDELKPKLALDEDEPEPRMTIMCMKDYIAMKDNLKENYKVGFVDGIIASSVTYIVITLIALFIGSYQ